MTTHAAALVAVAVGAAVPAAVEVDRVAVVAVPAAERVAAEAPAARVAALEDQAVSRRLPVLPTLRKPPRRATSR